MGTATVLDIWHGYRPLAAQQAFHNSDAAFRLYAGAFGAGKTKAGCREAIRTALEYPNSLGIIARLHYPELIDSTWQTMLKEIEETGLLDAGLVKIKGGRDRAPEMYFSSEIGGSRIWFRNLDDPNKFLGVEPDWWYIDEGAEVDEDVYQTLVGRLRGTKNPNGRVEYVQTYMGREIRTRVSGPLRGWVTTNPGPSSWLRRNFNVLVNPGRGWESEDGDYARFDARTEDNPYLDPRYIERMRAQYPAIWVKRFLEGDWSAFEGQVFPQLDESKHLLRGPYTIPEWADVYEGYDFGMRNPTAVVWMAVDPSGDRPPVVFAELEMSESTVEDVAKGVFAVRDRWGIDHGRVMCFGDPAGRAVGPGGQNSYVDQFMRQGIVIVPGQKNPIERAQLLAHMLETELTGPEGPLPGIMFTENVPLTWNAMAGLQWKPKTSGSPEDAPERIIKRNDHLPDALGYEASMVPVPGTPSPVRMDYSAAAKPMSPALIKEWRDSEPETVDW